MVIYRYLLGRMCDKCSLFVGDFYKFVVPCAKNDLANNILYLQQLQIQNNDDIDSASYISNKPFYLLDMKRRYDITA